MGKSVFYVAPCWSIAPTLNDTAQGEKDRFVIDLFDEEYELATGLAHMADQGWQLWRVQPNLGEDCAPLHNWRRPEFFYLFVRGRLPAPSSTSGN